MVQKIDRVFSLLLEGNYTASELVKRGGYQWFDKWITDDRFPLGKHQPVTRTLELLELDYDPTFEDILREFQKRGLKRPTAEDAFYFGIQYQDEQRKNPIIFLHEPALTPNGYWSVLFLYGDVGILTLRLSRFDVRRYRHDRFAGVRES